MAFQNKYYSLKNILSYHARYNIIIGERSNGKTYSVLERFIERYARTGAQCAIIRRWDEDFKSKRGASMFSALASDNKIAKLTNGEWTDTYYYAGKWYMCRYDEDGKRITDDNVFCYAFSISSGEHDKSTSYPAVKSILFDEFITRTAYLPDEFVLFMNLLSTIIRERNDVEIFMLGNTVNKYCPYFKEMGLKHIREMQQGTIDLYKYGESGLTVAVEYCKPSRRGKKSDVYFAFDNPKLSMITGGTWEIDIYPHCPVKYRPKNVLFTYFIQFAGDTLQCEIVQTEKLLFTFIHRKTTPIKDWEHDLVFTPDYSPSPNIRRNITKPRDKIGDRIAEFYRQDRVFYADNDIGEIVRNYLIWCGKRV